MSAAPIHVRGLEKAFGSNEVLRGVDVQVDAGTIHGYIGPNGAGKTTTVRALLGLDTAFAGEVSVVGFDPRVDALEVKRRVGYLPESAVLYEALTAAEFLLLVGRLHGLEDDAIRSRAEAFLGELDLGDRLGARLVTLSKGMRQKLLLTAALLPRPDVLFVDEPLSGLDVSSGVLIKHFFRGFADRGGAILYCSHVMDVVERVCDRISILDGGRIVASGTFDELAAGRGGGSLEDVFGRITSEGGEAERAERLLDALVETDR